MLHVTITLSCCIKMEYVCWKTGKVNQVELVVKMFYNFASLGNTSCVVVSIVWLSMFQLWYPQIYYRAMEST